jgi:hypothetical protein
VTLTRSPHGAEIRASDTRSPAVPSPTAPIPLSFKLAYGLFLLVLVPVYWHHYGTAHFLWFSDVVLLLTFVAVVFEQRLLASMQAAGGLVLESFWMLDFLVLLVTGIELTGLTAYMLEADRELYLRLLSLFHVAMPPILLWLVWRWGYDRRAFGWQALLIVAVIPASYLFTDPDSNVNWVHGYENIGFIDLHPIVYLIGLTLFLVMAVLWPTHRALLWWRGDLGQPAGAGRGEGLR